MTVAVSLTVSQKDILLIFCEIIGEIIGHKAHFILNRNLQIMLEKEVPQRQFPNHAVIHLRSVVLNASIIPLFPRNALCPTWAMSTYRRIVTLSEACSVQAH